MTDQTGVVEGNYVDTQVYAERYVAGGEPSSESSTLVTAQFGGFSGTTELTPIMAVPIIAAEALADVRGVEATILTKARSTRIALLAKKYAGECVRLETEEQARFTIETEKLRRLSPRVSNSERASLEQAKRLAERSNRLVSRVRSKLGLSGDG